ncbi:hypothetical protein KKH36_01510 [Patescibacteria group bacterium]|nr:hypothetical protein [Patescibacteria group bacterium]
MKTNKKNLKKIKPIIFQEKEVRRIWDEKKEEWYFSVIDIVSILTEQIDFKKAKSYWTTLKKRLKDEGSQLVTDCDQLKLKSADGKFYLTDVADTRTIFRLVQSIPSKKAEPFKLWLAKVGNERINEIYDPEIAINRAIKTYQRKGYDEKWINQRLKSIEIRKELTDEWNKRGVTKDVEYAILTNEILKSWSEMNTQEYKKFKGLKKDSLKDNMTNLELVLNMLAETSTTEISKTEKPQNFNENKKVAKKGGTIAKKAKIELEKKLKRKILKGKN